MLLELAAEAEQIFLLLAEQAGLLLLLMEDSQQ
jgi:hypothetical protein